MFTNIKNFVKSTPLIIPFIIIKNVLKKNKLSQSNEAEIIDSLLARFEVPHSFVEFGFSGWEFNCIKIANEWEGLLIDSNDYNIAVAKRIFSKKIIVKKMWLTLETLDYVIDYIKTRKLGILSIDVDGNDYWFLEKLIVTRPKIIIVEFNVAFGLRPISVPYDRAFDRTKKHESWEYYGASIAAMNYICERNNYSLLEISHNGVNAFFVSNDLLSHEDQRLSSAEAYRNKIYPDGSIAPASEIWEKVKKMPYVDISQENATQFSHGSIVDS